MTLTIPDDVRAKAEIYVGDAAGQEKTRFLLEETGLPSGLLPLRDIVECGYVEETGFVWLRQRRKVDHYFAKAGRHVSYGAEVSAVAEKGRLKKITGVKAKEMLVWVTLHEICLDGAKEDKLVCKAIGGLSRTFPAEAFQAPERVTPVGKGDAGAGAGAGAGVEEVEAAAKKLQDGDVKKKPEEEEVKSAAAETKECPAAAKEEQTKEEEGQKKAEQDVDKVEEKLKEMSTAEGAAAQAEAVAAKN